ncbi:MAG: helix-turn-helix domain-containing protein [Hyphomicrobiaceae bacterium]|nr:helix-turn-helix domain-containing protein [Hyphomicrobiaceae bacterium]
MQKVFLATDYHPRDRLASWYDIAAKLYAGHQCNPDKSIMFDVSIEASKLGDIETTILQSNPAHFVREQRHITDASPASCFLCRQQTGSSIWRQGGRECRTDPGDLTILDAQKPYELYLREKGTILVLKVPMRAITQRMGPTIGLTAIVVPAGSSLGGIASGFLAMLPDRLPIAQERAAAQVAEHALDLFAMALLAQTTGARAMLSSAKETGLAALRAAIDTNLSDPSLNAGQVAKAAGISVRYASQLLSEQGTSVARYILDRRLEQCRRLLGDPNQLHRSITEIALSWGFSDPSHFSRRFRQAYGMSPSESRPEIQKLRG